MPVDIAKLREEVALLPRYAGYEVLVCLAEAAADEIEALRAVVEAAEQEHKEFYVLPYYRSRDGTETIVATKLWRAWLLGTRTAAEHALAAYRALGEGKA